MKEEIYFIAPTSLFRLEIFEKNMNFFKLYKRLKSKIVFFSVCSLTISVKITHKNNIR